MANSRQTMQEKLPNPSCHRILIDMMHIGIYFEAGFCLLIAIKQLVLSPVKLTLIKTKTQFFLSNQIVVIFRHGLVISFSGNELIREVHYSSTNLFL